MVADPLQKKHVALLGVYRAHQIKLCRNPLVRWWTPEQSCDVNKYPLLGKLISSGACGLALVGSSHLRVVTRENCHGTNQSSDLLAVVPFSPSNRELISHWVMQSDPANINHHNSNCQIVYIRHFLVCILACFTKFMFLLIGCI